MDIILVPGLWLDASSWDAVTPTLERSGHRVQALTLPGMESKDADRSGITLQDHVKAVVAAIDATDPADGPVLLVGHSVGCGICHGAVDARPERVARVVHIGGFPAPAGTPMLPGLPAENGEVSMPDWTELGEEANIVDFDADSLAQFYADAIPAPEGVLTGALELSDQRRYDVPVTAVCPEYTATDLRRWLADHEEPVSELAKVRDVEYVDLSSGHWPQLTQPTELAQVILDAAIRTRPAHA
ncbi:pimeloyl-ACP methyl ester carboxylesterase [Haloactinopolyspora alba]|uniref:Pimeloyl-ACP methyl ester carboxylesterase n=1 Tax=Haloactinopolyspora alba TaxID=648780 RepID=A0A2P8EBN5_9ACTN|nr:alpha/beta hydrolase [Haloactinopolyspora alba]PSL06888.1 pimeloyl-ACP methyl ester carboxylesterase [Haloactinopolyspora alba]